MTKQTTLPHVPDHLLLVKAIPVAADRMAVLCHDQPAAAQGIRLSQVLTVDTHGRWTETGCFRWHGVDMAFTGNAELLVLGRNRQVGSIVAGTTHECWLEKGRAMGPMRAIVSSGDKTLAFGMNRHAYLADGPGWRRFERGFDASDSPAADIDFDTLLYTMGGLNAVARSASGEFIAVGMNGEIWRSPNSQDAWVKQASPTQVGLSAVFVDSAGIETAVGQAGTIVQNRGTGWEALAYRGPQGLDFTSAVSFASQTLLADGHSLRRLQDGVLELVNPVVPQIVPCARLATGFGMVVGCAPQELFFSRDGIAWTLVI